MSRVAAGIAVAGCVACGRAPTRPTESPPAIVASTVPAVTIDAGAADAGVTPADAAPVAKPPCAAIVAVVEKALGPIDRKTPEQDWVALSRHRMVAGACEGEWDAEQRQCLTTATTVDAINACFEKGFIGFYDTDIDQIDANAKKIAAARKRKPTCKQVDAALTPMEECYGPLKVSGDTPHHVRDQQYRDCLRDTHQSRLDRCRVQRWSPWLRACFVALGPFDARDCLDDGVLEHSETGFELLTSLTLGDMPIECAAYAQIAKDLGECTSVSAALDRARGDMTAALERWRGLASAKRAAVGAECRAGYAALRAVSATGDCGL